MVQDRSMLAQVGPKMPKMAPKGLQVPQDEAKITSRWPPDRCVLASWSFFVICVWTYVFQCFLLLFGSFASINSCQFFKRNPMKFESFLASWVVHAPSWLKLDPSWLKLDPCWPHFQVPSRPWANPSPSKSLPCGLRAYQTPICALQD